MPPFKDLTGEKINNWNILGFEGFSSRGESTWLSECQCIDMTTEIKTVSSVRRAKQCRECNTRDRIDKLKEENIGKTHGKLTIVGCYGYRDDVTCKGLYWIAKCDCGSKKDVVSVLYNIKKGKVRSCGCLNGVALKEYYSNNEPKRNKYNSFVEKDDYYIGVTDKGEFMFDKEDYDKVLDINRYWSINNIGYVLCTLRNSECQLHRYLMGLGKYNRGEDIIVDHINGDKLDNRKSNLRITHRRNNPKNTSLYSNNTSGHKGVGWHKGRSKWQASINVNKKSVYLGIYDNLDEAIEARKKAEIKYFGEYSRDYREYSIGDDIIE